MPLNVWTQKACFHTYLSHKLTFPLWPFAHWACVNHHKETATSCLEHHRMRHDHYWWGHVILGIAREQTSSKDAKDFSMTELNARIQSVHDHFAVLSAITVKHAPTVKENLVAQFGFFFSCYHLHLQCTTIKIVLTKLPEVQVFTIFT